MAATDGRSAGRHPQRRQPRARKPRGRSMVGTRAEVEVGPIAHGGFCIARLDGRAVFVRHALPGERVVVEVTEGAEDDRFWRADAVEVLTPSPDRVEAPCRFAGPDLCGGCDFQHVAVPAQRALKATVVAEQLRRLAGLEIEVTVEQVPGDEEGLHWRTRQRYVDLPGGLKGMKKHRSHEVVAIDTCLIEAHHPASHVVRGVDFEVARDGFWQVHPGAPEVLVSAVLDALQPQPGDHALDLYSGVGLFARFLLEAVGETGRVVAIEGDPQASALSTLNVPGIVTAAGDVAAVLSSSHPEPVELVVLDPPREGAKRAVVEQVVARSPRVVAYVACDPAALARDVAIFAEHGYELTGLRAFDLFPMTHHVECVAVLRPTSD